MCSNLKTVRAYLFKETFRQLWEHHSPIEARKLLDQWRRQIMRSRIEPMKKIARSLGRHRELILNYFRAQKLLPSGGVESLKDQDKVTMRESYGFRNFPTLELALYHSRARLPQSTHAFFRRTVDSDTAYEQFAEADAKNISSFGWTSARSSAINALGSSMSGSRTGDFQLWVSSLFRRNEPTKERPVPAPQVRGPVATVLNPHPRPVRIELLQRLTQDAHRKLIGSL
jgi:hypothetical protein